MGNMRRIGRRVMVIGMSGSGKSTLAAAIAARLGVPLLELDGVNHGPGWTPAPREQFRATVAAHVAGDGWVTDGTYRVVRDLLWARADTVVWLDYPIAVPLWRVTWRTLRRVIGRVELWNGNRETWRNAVFNRENLVMYILRNYRRRRRDFAALAAQPEHAHVTVFRLRSPRAAERLLASLPAPTATPPVTPAPRT